MDRRRGTASAMLYVVSAVTVCFGILYTTTSSILPYHERFLGTPHGGLDPAVATLMLAFMRVVGASFLTLGTVLAAMVKTYLVQGDRRAWWIILFMVLTPLSTLLLVTLRIGPYTPWWVVAGLIALSCGALTISRPFMHRDGGRSLVDTEIARV